MSELKEQPEQEVITSQTVANQAKEKDHLRPAAKSRFGILSVALLLLLILGLAGAGFYFFTQLRDKQEGLGGEVKKELTSQINDYQKQLTAIQSQVAAVQSELAGKDEHFSKTLANFSDLSDQKMDATRKELSDKVLQVQRQLGKTRGDWLIADAEYLLSVANERLHLVGDINTTREALEAADQRLRESGDTGTITIREQIAKEISLIKGVKVPDVVGLYSSIQALGSDTPKLTLVQPYSGKPLTPSEEASNSSAISEDSSDLLNSAIKELEGVVTIKHSDKPIKEILSQEQAEFIREQLKVKLEILKIALVQQNDELYQSGLADIKAWVEQHFTDNDKFKAFMAELSSLKAIQLRSQLPDISVSLKMLRDVTKLRLETDKALQSQEDVKTDTEKPPEMPAAEKQPEEPTKPADSSQPAAVAPPQIGQ